MGRVHSLLRSSGEKRRNKNRAPLSRSRCPDASGSEHTGPVPLGQEYRTALTTAALNGKIDVRQEAVGSRTNTDPDGP